MERTLQPGGVYRHYKGNLYKALYVATHTETEEPLAVYQALYGEHGIWARPLAMFLDDVYISSVFLALNVAIGTNTREAVRKQKLAA